MILAIAWDVLLILQIELNRSAIKKASEALQNPMILNIHVTLAVLTVVCYAALIIFGKQLMKNNNKNRQKHKIRHSYLVWFPI